MVRVTIHGRPAVESRVRSPNKKPGQPGYSELAITHLSQDFTELVRDDPSSSTYSEVHAQPTVMAVYVKVLRGGEIRGACGVCYGDDDQDGQHVETTREACDAVAPAGGSVGGTGSAIILGSIIPVRRKRHARN